MASSSQRWLGRCVPSAHALLAPPGSSARLAAGEALTVTPAWAAGNPVKTGGCVPNGRGKRGRWGSLPRAGPPRRQVPRGGLRAALSAAGLLGDLGTGLLPDGTSNGDRARVAHRQPQGCVRW